MVLNPIRKFYDEVVVVRHLHLRQGLRIHRLILRDQVVGREQVSADRIDLVVAQRMRRRPRHGATDIVEQRRRIGPEIGDRLVRGDAVGGQRWIADQYIARAALAVALAADPAILIADEPTAEVDAETECQMIELIVGRKPRKRYAPLSTLSCEINRSLLNAKTNVSANSATQLGPLRGVATKRNLRARTASISTFE